MHLFKIYLKIEHDTFETDDYMTLLLINNKNNKSLELYFIKYIFNTKNFDHPKLKKIDE